MSGSGGAVIAVTVGDLSGRDNVAMCGNSLSLKSERPSGATGPTGMGGLRRPAGGMAGKASRGSDGPAKG